MNLLPLGFEAQITKPSTLGLRLKPRNCRGGFEAKPLTNRRHQFLGQTRKPVLLVSSTCTMRVAHDITWAPDCLAPEYPTCAWLSPILYTKSPTPTSIHIVARHVAFATYMSWDKQTRFSTSNNLIWVSSIEMRWIQIQTRTSQFLITHINQGRNHLVSQSPPWWVHWQLQVHKVWILNWRPIEAQLNDHKPKTSSKMVI
jgi:hypothetical protein